MRLLAVSISVTTLTACTVAGPKVKPCTDSSECRANFGAASVCQTDGFCAIVDPLDACDTPHPPDLFDDNEAYGDAIILGATVHASDDPVLEEVMRLSVTLVNDQGGLDGQPIGLALCTIDGNADEVTGWLGETLAVPAIVGGASDSAALQLRDGLPTETLLLSPAANGSTFHALDVDTSFDSPGMSWGIRPPAADEASAIAADLSDRGLTDIALLVHDVGGPAELADDLESAWTGTLTRYDYEDSSDRNTQLSAIGSATATEAIVVLAADDAQAAPVLNTAAVLAGFETQEFFFSSASASAAWLPDASGATELLPRVRGIRGPAREDRLVFQHLDSALDATGDSDADASRFSAETWDATWLAMFGVAWADRQEQSHSAISIARGLRSFSQGPPVSLIESGWTDAVGRFVDTANIDVDGASSDLSITDDETVDIDFRAWVVNSEGTALVPAP